MSFISLSLSLFFHPSAAIQRHRSLNRNRTGRGNNGEGRLSKKFGCPAQLTVQVMVNLHYQEPILVLVVTMSEQRVHDGDHGLIADYVMDIDKSIGEAQMALVWYLAAAPLFPSSPFAGY